MSQRPAHKRMCSKRLWLALFLALLILLLRSLSGSLFLLSKSQEGNREKSKKKNYTNTVVFTLHPKYNLASEVPIQAAPERSLRLLEHDLKRLRKNAAAARHSGARMLITGMLSLMFPVRGNIIPNGLYYVAMHVGNPAKAYYFDMDTGSDLTWLQCDAPCRNCGKVPNGLYDPKKGGRVVDCRHAFCAKVQRGGSYPCEEMSNHRWPQCDYEREFVDGASTMGLLMNDAVTLLFSNGTRIRTTAIIGCGYDQQGSLAKDPQPTDGVMGLSSSTEALPSQLAQKGIINNNVIGHCLAGGSHTRSYLFFGDALVPTSGMTWVPMTGRPGTEGYQAHVLSIHYGSDELKRGNTNIGGRVMFDSGTSFTYLLPEAYSTVLLAVQDHAKSWLRRLSTDTTLPYCWGGPFPFKSVADVHQYFKTITFSFDGSRTFELSPEGYLVLSTNGNICFGILDAKGASLETLNIIGDISMRGYLVVYDNVREQIGWVRNNCQSRPTS